MRIAILGAGFAGLAVTWYLLHYTRGTVTVDLFDPEPIGGGASGLSSGLLHPYGGKQAHRSWEADRGLKETHRLLTEASRAANRSFILSKGILRPAITEQQIQSFQDVAKQHDDVIFWDKTECEKKVAGLRLPADGGGLFIKDGLTIDVPGYLQGLWQACAVLGTQFRQQAMIRKSDLAHYDRVLVAMGPLSKSFPSLQSLPLTPLKGQVLTLKWPENLQPPPFSLISQKYLVMSPDHQTCTVGATYEREFSSPHPDPAKAAADILPNISAYFPALEHAKILRCRAGFRGSSPNHLPLVGKVSDQVYFFTALGSKGLLYHAFVGKYVARALITGDPSNFPSKLHHVITS